MSGVSPKQVPPDSENPDDLESQEIVNDSLGEETPSDSTGLNEDDESADPGKKQKPSNTAGKHTM